MSSISERPESTATRSRRTETLQRLLAAPGRRQALAGVVVAVAGPVLMTLLAAAISETRTAVPALLFILTVVGAAAVGHLWPALLSAVSEKAIAAGALAD